MTIRLEHANISVRDVDGMIRFLQTAFPEFRVRGEGITREGARWLHLGTDDTYIALSESRVEPGSFRPYSGVPGVNHLAYVIDDVEALRQRLAAAGYKDSTPPNDHPHANVSISMTPRATTGSLFSTYPVIRLNATITNCRIDNALQSRRGYFSDSAVIIEKSRLHSVTRTGTFTGLPVEMPLAASPAAE